MSQDQNAYLLSGETVKKLAKLVRDSERHSRNYHPPKPRKVVSVAPASWLGVLDGSLSYHGSATVSLYTFDSGLGYFTDSGLNDTCYGWLLLSGESIPANTQVVGCYVSGKRVVFDAACTTGT